MERPNPGPDTLRAVADAIEAEPERYNQAKWVDSSNICGTAYCVAGWAAAVHHGELVPMLGSYYGHAVEAADGSRFTDVSGVADVLVAPHGEVDTFHLFNEYWRPKDGMSVPEALRRLADGEDLNVISAGEWDDSAEQWHHRGPSCNIECDECADEFLDTDS